VIENLASVASFKKSAKEEKEEEQENTASYISSGEDVSLAGLDRETLRILGYEQGEERSDIEDGDDDVWSDAEGESDAAVADSQEEAEGEEWWRDPWSQFSEEEEQGKIESVLGESNVDSSKREEEMQEQQKDAKETATSDGIQELEPEDVSGDVFTPEEPSYLESELDEGEDVTKGDRNAKNSEYEQDEQKETKQDTLSARPDSPKPQSKRTSARPDPPKSRSKPRNALSKGKNFAIDLPLLLPILPAIRKECTSLIPKLISHSSTTLKVCSVVAVFKYARSYIYLKWIQHHKNMDTNNAPETDTEDDDDLDRETTRKRTNGRNRWNDIDEDTQEEDDYLENDLKEEEESHSKRWNNVKTREKRKNNKKNSLSNHEVEEAHGEDDDDEEEEDAYEFAMLKKDERNEKKWRWGRGRLSTPPSSIDVPKKKKSKRETLAELQEELSFWKYRTEVAESEREVLENDRTDSLRQLEAMKLQMNTLQNTNRYLKSQLRDNARDVESAVQAERQSAQDELTSMRHNMLEILERERALMQNQVRRTLQLATKAAALGTERGVVDNDDHLYENNDCDDDAFCSEEDINVHNDDNVDMNNDDNDGNGVEGNGVEEEDMNGVQQSFPEEEAKTEDIDAASHPEDGSRWMEEDEEHRVVKNYENVYENHDSDGGGEDINGEQQLFSKEESRTENADTTYMGDDSCWTEEDEEEEEPYI